MRVNPWDETKACSRTIIKKEIQDSFVSLPSCSAVEDRVRPVQPEETGKVEEVDILGPCA